MILKTLSTKYTAKYFEDKYNIKLKRQYRNVYIFTIDDINDTVEICKNIYENENVKYAQPSYYRTIRFNETF